MGYFMKWAYAQLDDYALDLLPVNALAAALLGGITMNAQFFWGLL